MRTESWHRDKPHTHHEQEGHMSAEPRQSIACEHLLFQISLSLLDIVTEAMDL